MPLADRAKIYPRLWQGSAPLAGEPVAGSGFDVLCVCAAEILRGPPYNAPDPFPGTRVERIALSDKWLDVEAKDQAERLGARLARQLEQGARLLIVCARGRNRSGLLSALTLCHRLGWSGRRALEQVQRHRPGALNNPWFAAYLLSRPA